MNDTLPRFRKNIVVIGQVDHGKSSLLGRLLFDAGVVPEDRIESVRSECERTGKTFEYAFLLDALKEERKQGITIDSARAVLRLERPTGSVEFLFFDAPGHADFTGNLASGATHAEACIIVVDAALGIQSTFERHARIVSLLGLRRIVVAINKMDSVAGSQERFNLVASEVQAILRQCALEADAIIPVSAITGDNIVHRSTTMNWYPGQTVLEAIEHDSFSHEKALGALRMEIQDVYKFSAQGDSRRIVAGTINCGTLSVGDRVVFYPTGAVSTVQSFENFPQAEVPIQTVAAGDYVGLTLNDTVFVQRGNVLCRVDDPPPICGNRVRAMILWLSKTPLEVEGICRLNIGTDEATARVVAVSAVEKESSGSDSLDGSVSELSFAVVEFETQKELAFFGEDELDLSRVAVTIEDRICGFGRILGAGAAPLPPVRESRSTRSPVSSDSRSDSRAPVLERRPAVEFTHTPEFPEFLKSLGASLFVSTYQAQRILALSVNEQNRVSMLMRIFERPTGLYVSQERMALVAKTQTWLFETIREVWDENGERTPHDLSYVPRRSFVTGDIAGHEIDYLNGEYVLVNTRFSCLARLSDRFSFEPIWRPQFVTELAAEDRCHINGMATDGVRPRFVTALGETNEKGGWRENKKNGGVLIDVVQNEVIARGLSMPHSPRIYGGRLWILESGVGELQVVDPVTGVREIVAKLPGYLRGLAFHDRFAFIGLCKIRESNMFGGLRVSELYPEPRCAIYVVDLSTGREVGFIEFTRGIEELFDIKVVPGVTRPQIIGFEEDTVNGLYVLPPAVG